MNARTTLFLAFLLLALVVVVLVYVPRGRDTGISEVELTGKPAELARRLIDDSELDQPAKVACARAGGEPWVFERVEPKDAAEPKWRMTAPLNVPAIVWEVDRFSRVLLGLEYEISYEPGQPDAVSAGQAGLEPPQTTFTLTDAGGKSVTLEVGKAAGPGTTYVRRPGSATIYAVKTNLSTLLKPTAIEYRDTQLWDFTVEKVKGVEITDRSAPEAPVDYRFARADGGWMMDAPAVARATDKVDQMLRTMSRLRVEKWRDDKPQAARLYGLDPAAVTVRVTVEEPVPQAPAAEGEQPQGAEPAAAPTEPAGTTPPVADKPVTTPAADGKEVAETDGTAPTETTEPKPPATRLVTYELHISSQSPIGEDTKVYVRIGDQTAVATLLKTSADGFRPVMAEWREMRVTTAPVKNANRIELAIEGTSAVLERQGSRWRFAQDDWDAQGEEVAALLTAIDGLKAVAFEDGVTGDVGPFGLDTPRAEVRLLVPGLAEPERIRIGSFTDTTAKLLVYVQRNASTSIAKVRVRDVEPLLRAPSTYRDRTVFALPADRIRQITIETNNRYLPERQVHTFARGEDAWRLVFPVKAEVDRQKFTELVEGIAGLSAQNIAGDDADAAAYGLASPAAKVSFFYQPPPTYRAQPASVSPPPAADEAAKPGAEPAPADGEPAEAPDAVEEAAQPADAPEGDGAAPAAAPAVDADADQGPAPMEVTLVQPPDEAYELLIGEHDGRVYAQRADRTVVYELGRAFLDRLRARYRLQDVLRFDAAAVVAFRIRSGEQTHSFERAGESWHYAPVPDLPLDDQKVKNLLLQLGDLKLEDYVTYGATDLARFGLHQPAQEAHVVLDDGAAVGLRVSAMKCPGDPKGSYYACLEDHADVFLLSPDTLNRFQVKLDELERR
ncbi:MAG TPA: DUF4340 domain-containing protein [Phycisphaerae bacterium]|nr:DUF4340 domain-containing protein [Phycisphaerae bacterium]HNU46265.1 DUF4340 domain-containing protein [Phycisphaerae bacterium]